MIVCGSRAVKNHHADLRARLQRRSALLARLAVNGTLAGRAPAR
jgi:hypothetical protein